MKHLEQMKGISMRKNTLNTSSAGQLSTAPDKDLSMDKVYHTIQKQMKDDYNSQTVFLSIPEHEAKHMGASQVDAKQLKVKKGKKLKKMYLAGGDDTKPVRLKDYVQHLFDKKYEENIERRVEEQCMKFQ